MVLVLAVLLCTLVGGALQRVSGMGVGMLAAPTFTLLLGPAAGVSLSNAAAVVSAVLLTLVLHRDVDWRRFLRLAPLLVAGSLAGAWAVRVLDIAWLEVVLGASILVAIAASLGLQRRLAVRGPGAALASGAVAGFMNTTAGVAGPALAVYAVASRWDQRSWAATLQPIFLLANVTSLTTKSLLGSAGLDAGVPAGVWAAVLVGVPSGILLGGLVARRVPAGRARGLALVLAGTGGAVALVRGLLAL